LKWEKVFGKPGLSPTVLADFDLQRQEIVEGLGDSHSQAHTLFDPHGQGLLGI